MGETLSRNFDGIGQDSPTLYDGRLMRCREGARERREITASAGGNEKRGSILSSRRTRLSFVRGDVVSAGTREVGVASAVRSKIRTIIYFIINTSAENLIKWHQERSFGELRAVGFFYEKRENSPHFEATRFDCRSPRAVERNFITDEKHSI